MLIKCSKQYQNMIKDPTIVFRVSINFYSYKKFGKKKAILLKYFTQPHLSDRQIRNPFFPQHSTHS